MSSATLIGVSYLSEPADESRIAGLTWATVSSDDRAKSRESWTRWDVVTSAAVLVLITLAYLYFRG